MRRPGDDRHVLTGSYALDALPGPEREKFERHLRRCASCRAEVRGLSETAAGLAMAQALEPPPGLERRVLAATYQTRQLPPQAGQRHLREGRGPHRARLRARLSRWVRAPRLAVAVAVACLAAAVTLGITQVVTHHQLQSARAGGAAITRVLSAPDARIRSTRTAAGGTASVVFSARQRAVVITTRGMPPLPAASIYQAWVISPSGTRSAGLLPGGSPDSPLLASGVSTADRIGITIEPAGGTARPTTAPVVVMTLAA